MMKHNKKTEAKRDSVSCNLEPKYDLGCSVLDLCPVYILLYHQQMATWPHFIHFVSTLQTYSVNLILFSSIVVRYCYENIKTNREKGEKEEIFN